MGYVCVLRKLQILQGGSRGNDAVGQMLHAETLERLCAEMAQQLLTGCGVGEHPVVKLEHAPTVAKGLLKLLFAGAVIEHLLGLEVAHELLHIGCRTLACEKLARRDVEERHAHHPATSEVDSSKEVVLLIVEHVVAHGHTWRNQLCDAALHELLRELGVLQLVADGHTLASAYELGQICVERMMREARHLGVAASCLRCAVRPSGERDAQYFRCRDSVVTVGLVEVAATEEQQRVGVLGLQREKLPHHRC